MAPRRHIYRPEETKRAKLNMKGTWTPEEDEVLLRHVKKYGPQDWSSIQSNGLLDRTGKSCRLRWVNKLRPGLKTGKLSPEEAEVVIKYQALLGNRWAEIAKFLTGRTDNDVKNFWSTRQKRVVRQEKQLPPPKLEPARQERQLPPPKLEPVRQERQLPPPKPKRAKQERQLPPLLPESAKGKRAVNQRGRGSTSLAIPLGWRVPQEPSPSMITFQNPKYEVAQSRSHEPLGVIHRIDAPMPRVLCRPAPDVAAMKPGSFSMVPYDTYAENPAIPRTGAGLPLALCDKPTIPWISQQKPSFSNTTFQASKYSVSQSRRQEPKEVKPSFSNILCLPPAVNTTCPVPSRTNAEKLLRRAGTRLASLHRAAFVEPLAKKTVSAPLFLGTNFGGGPFVKPLSVDPPKPLEESFVGSPTREIRFEDLPAKTRLMFDDPGRFFGISYT